LRKSEGGKGEEGWEEERQGSVSPSSGLSWSMIQAGFMHDKEEKSKSASKNKSIADKDGSKEKEPAYEVHVKNNTEKTQHPPDQLIMERNNEKYASGNKKNILSPIRTVEEEKSFRRNTENNEEPVMVALRSSDIELAENPFRGSVTGNEDTKELTPLSVKTSLSENTAKENISQNMYTPPGETKESEELKPLRSTQEKTISADEDSLMLQAFRTVEKQQNETVNKEMDEKAKLVTSVLGKTVKDMNQKGINVNLLNPNLDEINVPGCNENEIFFMNKEKMFLVSSEKLVHDISGLAQFEENLWSQIKNQDEIIKTLKARLKSVEKQEENMKYIVDTMKSSENARKKELQETKDLLQYSRGKIKHLENITEHQISKVHNAEKKMEKLKIKLYKKDSIIKDLRSRMKLGEQSAKVKYLEGEVEICQREKKSEQETRQILEKNLENLKAASLVLQQTGGKTQEDIQLMKKELADENNLIGLLKMELVNHKKDIQELKNIVLQKDVVVQGLQDQVVNFLSHDYHALQGCIEKDKQIDRQYQAMASMKNMTYIQDTLTRAKDTALKILQNTVYEMVEKIPQCSDTAVKGLKAEIKTLQDMQRPVNSEVEELKKALQATKNVMEYKETEEEHGAYKKLLSSQARSLQLCHQETKTQHRELKIKLEKDNRDLKLDGLGCDQHNCQQYCMDSRRSDPQSPGRMQSYANTTDNKENRAK